MKRIAYGLFLALVLGVCGARPVAAESLTVNFTGTFSSYFDSDNPTSTHPLIHNAVTGSIVFSDSHAASPDDLTENRTQFDHAVWNMSISGAPGLSFGGTESYGVADILDLGDAVNAALFTNEINLNLDWSPTSLPIFTLAGFPASDTAADAYYSAIMNSSGDIPYGSKNYGFSITGFTASVAATPLPATLPLFVSALAGLGFFGWRRRSAANC
jgi:hypothetical protein